MSVNQKPHGFTLIETLIVLLLILLLNAIALPYYLTAVESARMTEATLWWGQLKRQAADRDLTRTHNRIEKDINDSKKLKYFTVQIECRQSPEEEETQDPQTQPEQDPQSNGLCWEVQFHLKKPDQSIQYYLATQHNFTELLCVPLNRAGSSYCQSQAAREEHEAIDFQGHEAYLLHH